MNIPTGTKILFNRMRTEFQLEPTKNHNYRAFLGYGVTREIEAELMLDRFDRRPSVLTGDFSYNYLGALTDTLPGVSLGVRDIADRTEDGRQIYIAITYRVSAESEFNNDVPLELTLGAGSGRRSPLFVGVQVPFTWSFRLLAEHDGNMPRLGFEYFPKKDWSARLQFDERRTTLSLRWSARF